jgi:hypothetical protein
MSDNGRITPRQVRAMNALLEGKTRAAAAEEAGVTERTLYRWLAEDEAFKRTLRDAQDSYIDAATRTLSFHARRMALVLVAIAIDTGINPAVRVQAARAALVENLKIRDQRELAERITALEEMMNDGE